MFPARNWLSGPVSFALISIASATILAQGEHSPLRANNYFIEAEDFNFGHGQTITNTPIGMNQSYLGGAFQNKGNGLNGAACDGTDFGVDYLDDDSANQQPIYRPNTAVEVGRDASSGVNRGSFNVEVNHVVGWAAAGEWMNYTRTFPAVPRVYAVYARMTHGDPTQRRGGSLYKVTGDRTACTQTLKPLGTFSAPWTGGWEVWPETGTDQDALIPMKNADGVNYLELAGEVTLRWKFEEGGGNFDYLVFVEQDIVIDYFPRLEVVQPAEHADPAGILEASFGPQDEYFYAKSATVKLDGVTVPAEIKNLGSKTTFRYTPPSSFAAASAHQYEISVLDSFGNTTKFSIPFQITFTPLPRGALFIEGEDFDFGHGQTIANLPIGMDGPYLGGDFYDKGNGANGTACDGTDLGVDYSDQSSNDISQDATIANYRPKTAVEAAKRNGPPGLNRGTFQVQVNHVVGWSAAGEWMNYTRTFPQSITQVYGVYARMTHGSPIERRGGKLYEVTRRSADGCDQELRLLGTFSAPWTGGWDTWPDSGTDQDALIPLQSQKNGERWITIPTGVHTLRFEFTDGAGDFDYIAFVPWELEEPPGISISPTGEIRYKGVLESSETASGNYTQVIGATSPYVVPPTSERRFFRVRR